MLFPPNSKLNQAAQTGDLATVQRILAKRVTRWQATDALLEAAQAGHLDCLKALIPHADPKFKGSYVLQHAVRGRHTDCLKALIPVCNPKAMESMALVEAALGGWVEGVEILLPVSDPKSGHSSALQCAALNNHVDVVTLLLPVSRTSRSRLSYLPLLQAANSGARECVALLVGQVDVMAAWHALRRNQQWKGLEALAEHVAPRWWTAAVQAAPREEIPGLYARWVAQGLGDRLSADEAPAARRHRL